MTHYAPPLSPSTPPTTKQPLIKYDTTSLSLFYSMVKKTDSLSSHSYLSCISATTTTKLK